MSLEIMFTNGISHWSEFVPNSDISLPLIIDSVKVSKNKSTILVRYTSKSGSDLTAFVRTFKRISSGNFEIVADAGD